MKKDELRAVLPGGKHHQVATAWLASDKVAVQARRADESWDDWTFPAFSESHEYRIKPASLRYRVALMRGIKNSSYIAIANTNDEAATLEWQRAFAKWLGDWQEVEVDRA